MDNKILEGIGIENENVDGGAFNDFSAGGKSGIVSGVLDECKITFVSNILTVGKGLLLIKGIRVKILDPIDFSLQGNPAVPINYQLVARIVLSPDRSISFNLFTDTTQNLVNDAIYKTEQGTYDLRLATFIHATDGTISNLVVTAELLTNKSSGVLKTSFKYGTAISLSGTLFSPTKTDEEYHDAEITSYASFISKGTLENIKYHYVKRALVDNDITLTDEEKENAQKWLGLEKEYEHKITFDFVGLDSDADGILSGSNGRFTITAPTKTTFTTYEELKSYLEVGQKIDWGYFGEDGTWVELSGKGYWEIIAINDTDFTVTDSGGTILVVAMTNISDIVTEAGMGSASVEIDKTLTVEGAAADAKTVGEKLAEKVGFKDFPDSRNFKAGVIKIDNFYGMSIGSAGSEGVLIPMFASNNAIDKKYNNRFIGSHNIDYAVLKSLTTNTQTMTDEQKSTACEWLGLKKVYKHVLDVTPINYSGNGYTAVNFQVIVFSYDKEPYKYLPTDYIYRSGRVWTEADFYGDILWWTNTKVQIYIDRFDSEHYCTICETVEEAENTDYGSIMTDTVFEV